MYGGMDVQTHVFLTSALVGGEWSALRPISFTPDTHWLGGWLGPQVHLDNMEKWKFMTLPELKLWPLGRPIYVMCIDYDFIDTDYVICKL
jgi:hypothetical protein